MSFPRKLYFWTFKMNQSSCKMLHRKPITILHFATTSLVCKFAWLQFSTPVMAFPSIVVQAQNQASLCFSQHSKMEERVHKKLLKTIIRKPGQMTEHLKVLLCWICLILGVIFFFVFEVLNKSQFWVIRPIPGTANFPQPSSTDMRICPTISGQTKIRNREMMLLLWVLLPWMNSYLGYYLYFNWKRASLLLV